MEEDKSRRGVYQHSAAKKNIRCTVVHPVSA